MAWSKTTEHYVREHFANGADILRAVELVQERYGRQHMPLSAALACLTKETGGANVFGHDPVKPPQIVGGKVTRARYLRYKALRRLCGNQGVGPCQLTSPGLQDEADKRGGCWKPIHNLTVGLGYLAKLHADRQSMPRAIGARAWQLAFTSYNGSGPAAVAYGMAAVALKDHYHEVLS